MTIRNFLLSAAVILMLSFVASSQKVMGVWRLDEVKTTGTNGSTNKITQPSMYLFTKSHYSIIYVNSDKPRSTDDPSKMTVGLLNQTYVDDFVANAGTYDLTGGKLTFHVMVAKSPTYMSGGNWVSFSVKVIGNTMTMTSVGSNSGPATNPATLTFTRVE